MDYRKLGKSGLSVSRIALGAGPIAQLMTGDDPSGQRAVLRRAWELGINWIDTAATYGDGRSETALGIGLQELQAGEQFQIATKVRIELPENADRTAVAQAVESSLRGSLKRLQVPRITLLQLHNAVTVRRGDQPTSLSPDDVLGPGGVLDCFLKWQREGWVEQLGITGLGDPVALRNVLNSEQFSVVQIPYSVANPTAGQDPPAGWEEQDHGNLIADCGQLGVGVLAIRVFAGGALLQQPPAPHTYHTRFFPLDLYRRDQRRAAALAKRLPAGMTLGEAALRFALSHPLVDAAIVGIADPQQLDDAVRSAAAGPLPFAVNFPLD